MKKSLLLFLFFVNFGTIAFTQNRTLLDKVFAIVGGKIVLRSDIQNQIADLQRQGVELPSSPECSLLEQEIIKKVMAMQAEKDSLIVSNEEIEAEIENRVKYFIMMYGGKNELEQIAGRTIFQMKEYFRMPIQESLLAKNMQRKIVEDVKTTPSEVKAYFEKIPKDSLVFYETELQVGQIVIYPKANKDVEDYIIESLKEIKEDVEKNGKNFESLAKLYTEDPGSKTTGGRYEINKNEKQWDPVFLSTAFRLKEGEISKVVKSKFGYHIIQMVSRYGDDAVVRHILKIPPIREQDIEPVVKLQDSLRDLLIEGKKSFSQVVAEYNEDESSKFTAGFVSGSSQSTLVTIDELDPEIVTRLKDMKVGDYSKPFVFRDQRGKTGVKMIFLKLKTDPHKEDIALDYTKIQNKLIEMKRANMIKNWVNQKVPSFFLQVDSQFQTCNSNIEKWHKDSKVIGAAY